MITLTAIVRKHLTEIQKITTDDACRMLEIEVRPEHHAAGNIYVAALELLLEYKADLKATDEQVIQLEAEIAGMKLMEAEAESFAEGIVAENERLRKANLALYKKIDELDIKLSELSE